MVAVSRGGKNTYVGSISALNYYCSERLSRETASTSISRASHSTMPMPISDLEHRLSTVRTLDIFSMKPKVSIVIKVAVRYFSL